MTTKPKTRKAQPTAKAATIPSGIAAEAKACFMELCESRDNSEIERIKAFLEVAFPRPSKAEKTERDTTLREAEEAQERLTNVRLTDEIYTMSRRCFGLEAAIHGADDWGCDERHGVLQLATDLANGMARLAEAFEAERQLRSAEERQ